MKMTMGLDDLSKMLNEMGIKLPDETDMSMELERDFDLDSQEIVELTGEIEDEFNISTKSVFLKRQDTLLDVIRKVNCLITACEDSIVDEITISCPIKKVKEAIWNLSDWERLLTHIEKIDIIKETPSMQSFKMAVKMEGKEECLKVESFRIKVDDMIFFNQPVPPKYLSIHKGKWEFVENTDQSTTIRLHHLWVSNDYAAEYYKCEDKKVRSEKIRNDLRTHAMQTLNMWKGILNE